MSTLLVGLDLSGPSNTADTVLTLFLSSTNEGPDGADSARLLLVVPEAGDLTILRTLDTVLATKQPQIKHVVAGIDAPLSYNPGGGDRPADTELRALLHAAGLHSGTVMAPTMTRMAYLSLRGISVARLLGELPAGHSGLHLEMYEAHPAGAMVLRGAPVEDVRRLKRERGSREALLNWLEGQGLKGCVEGLGIPGHDPSDHYLASCAAALAAWGMARRSPAWFRPAEPPLHPFGYCC